MQHAIVRHDWTLSQVKELFEQPFNDLLFQAASVHRQNFKPNEVQISTLLSIKTGACPEDCKYCPQSGHYKTDLERERLMEVEKVIEQAKLAKDKGATRFCMGAAWSDPKDRDMPYIEQMVKGVKELGLETCMTLGMLDNHKAHALKSAGLDYYNHNLDTSAEYYEQIITTRTYQDRLDTIDHVRDAGMKVCSGGIVGMGEEAKDRFGLLMSLANLPQQPESVPINMLVKVKGTPLENVDDLDHFEFIRTIAVARIMMPKSYVRLSAGRTAMNEQMQSMCFFAGANSIFYGDKLLTTENPEADADMQLLKKLGMKPETHQDYSDEAYEASLSSAIADKETAGLFYEAR
ncbi:biotin synthase BioB [Pseudoalteromonas tunicata]|jgi:biotin synthase|uniref:Biotin synthase n=1 Tax=Pseudoalteromonas tunicata D2 TaxID=87626 RepID=A4C9I9_9GAMM|nr:biotin synthase BioB [Pseudoalteromonas tunicata]ATC94594.1 biotin synthase [Pseudoalteromonas tunicata]AXT30320.1 biotin synthase BioB [Pseudoalteromonas tunicata]EAR28047.1 biotin synthase; contains an iron-sulfur cluster and PLP [Pseudoalteromonas tunicata D2]MDP4984460.1 biotin synthase BioB [Pseudoalteromonas tunicata]